MTQRTPDNTNGAKVRYLSEFYNYDEVRAFLKERGIEVRSEQFHEEPAFTLQLMAIEPEAARYEERLRSGGERLGGLWLGNKAELTELGREILSRRAEGIAAAIRGGQ